MSASIQPQESPFLRQPVSHESVPATLEQRDATVDQDLAPDRIGQLDIAYHAFAWRDGLKRVPSQQNRYLVGADVRAVFVNEGHAVAVAIPGNPERSAALDHRPS